MIGEALGTLKGKVTGQRVLPSEGAAKVETSFEVHGTLAGVPSTMMGTYWSVVRADGSLYGECPRQGVVMTPEGVGTWTAAGIGHFTGKGTGVDFRGAVYFQTVPQKLARLTKVAAVYEWDVDEHGNAEARFT